MSDLNHDELSVDVNSWDKVQEIGKLSLRLIQVLEHRGVSIEYLKKRVDDGTEWLSKLNQGGSKALLEHVHLKCNSESRVNSRDEDTDMFDDDLLFRMASVSVPRDEPAFARLIEHMVRIEAESMRNKVMAHVH